MNLTATQIEDIVRVVVERLRSGVAATVVQTPQPKVAEPTVGEVHLSERVITLESLKDKLSGAKSIVVHPKAVVTPAVKDTLRQQGIRLVRQLPSIASSSVRPAPLLLLASESHHSMLSKRVCSKQATSVLAGELADAVLVIDQHLAEGKLGAVWCSPTPFACSAATYGNSRLRAVQLSELQDLPRAIEQAQPNVLIIDCHRWSPPSIANLVSNWYRSLR
jgi:hypothetical protein